MSSFFFVSHTSPLLRWISTAVASGPQAMSRSALLTRHLTRVPGANNACRRLPRPRTSACRIVEKAAASLPSAAAASAAGDAKASATVPATGAATGGALHYTHFVDDTLFTHRRTQQQQQHKQRQEQPAPVVEPAQKKATAASPTGA